MVCGFCGKGSCFPGLMEAAIESVGAGLRPRPLSREGGDCRRIRRGRPMCRPGHGFSRNLLTGGHIGPPLRGVGRCSGTNGNWRRTEAFPNGAGRSPPPTREPEQGGASTAAGCSHPALRKQRRWCPAKGRCGHRPLRMVAESCRDLLGSALSAERVAGQIRVLPDTLKVQHGVQGPEVSAKPRPCSRRGCVN